MIKLPFFLGECNISVPTIRKQVGKGFLLPQVHVCHMEMVVVDVGGWGGQLFILRIINQDVDVYLVDCFIVLHVLKQLSFRRTSTPEGFGLLQVQ